MPTRPSPEGDHSMSTATAGAESSRRRPSRGETRERILEVALQLFNEQGYDKTSLREIAGRLDVTKAALYYHFERKEDILLELHRRLDAIGRDLFDQLDALDDEEVVSAWPHLLDQFVDRVLANCKLFLLRQRNQSALAQLAQDEDGAGADDGVEQRVRRILSNPAIPLPDRVRMACSIGGVISALMGASGVFGEVPTPELARLVRGAVHDLFPA